MDPLLKELTKLEKLTAANAKGPSIAQSLDSLLESLHRAKEDFLSGNCSEDYIKQLAQTVEMKKKEVDERQKEVYAVLSRFGKALDKVWPLASDRYISWWRIQSTEISYSFANLFRSFLLAVFCHSFGTDHCSTSTKDRPVWSRRDVSQCMLDMNIAIDILLIYSHKGVSNQDIWRPPKPVCWPTPDSQGIKKPGYHTRPSVCHNNECSVYVAYSFLLDGQEIMKLFSNPEIPLLNFISIVHSTSACYYHLIHPTHYQRYLMQTKIYVLSTKNTKPNFADYSRVWLSFLCPDFRIQSTRTSHCLHSISTWSHYLQRNIAQA